MVRHGLLPNLPVCPYLDRVLHLFVMLMGHVREVVWWRWLEDDSGQADVMAGQV